MIEVRQSAVFSEWFTSLSDIRAKARIQARIDRIVLGNLGDFKLVGGGVGEFRIDYGPGYRLYFVRRGDTIIFLLCGGDKATQDRDIRKAIGLAKDL